MNWLVLQLADMQTKKVNEHIKVVYIIKVLRFCVCVCVGLPAEGCELPAPIVSKEVQHD